MQYTAKCRQVRTIIAQFEFIPWILGQCANVQEARVLLSHINLVDTPFNEKYPVSPLHWILADKEEAITIESVQEGLKIYDNPVGVLTNNPPFPIQMFRLNDYMSLSSESPTNRFSADLKLKPYSRGMGAMGLPGDLSSASRFVRVAFTKMNSLSGLSESESVSQFFHILGSVDQTRGCCQLDKGEYEITIYTSCCNADRGIYYYTTYENHQITAVDMYRENLDSDRPVHYPLVQGEHILLQNAAAGSCGGKPVMDVQKEQEAAKPDGSCSVRICILFRERCQTGRAGETEDCLSG